MNKFELFGPKVDFLIVPIVTAAAIYLFYGGLAAVLAVALIAVASHLKPLQRSGYDREQLALVSAGLVLTLSVFLRSFFFESYCSTASWAVNAGVHEMLGVQMPCFIRGGYLQYVTQDSWRSVLRDVVMPITGLALLFIALPRGAARRNGTLAACFLLLLGLWLNGPLLAHEQEARPGAARVALPQATATAPVEPVTQDAPASDASAADASISSTSELSPSRLLTLGSLSDDVFQDYHGEECDFTYKGRLSLTLIPGAGAIKIGEDTLHLRGVPSDYNSMAAGGQFTSSNAVVNISPDARKEQDEEDGAVWPARVRVERDGIAANFSGTWNCGA